MKTTGGHVRKVLHRCRRPARAGGERPEMGHRGIAMVRKEILAIQRGTMLCATIDVSANNKSSFPVGSHSAGDIDRIAMMIVPDGGLLGRWQGVGFHQSPASPVLINKGIPPLPVRPLVVATFHDKVHLLPIRLPDVSHPELPRQRVTSHGVGTAHADGPVFLQLVAGRILPGIVVRNKIFLTVGMIGTQHRCWHTIGIGHKPRLAPDGVGFRRIFIDINPEHPAPKPFVEALHRPVIITVQSLIPGAEVKKTILTETQTAAIVPCLPVELLKQHQLTFRIRRAAAIRDRKTAQSDAGVGEGFVPLITYPRRRFCDSIGIGSWQIFRLRRVVVENIEIAPVRRPCQAKIRMKRQAGQPGIVCGLHPAADVQHRCFCSAGRLIFKRGDEAVFP